MIRTSSVDACDKFTTKGDSLTFFSLRIAFVLSVLCYSQLFRMFVIVVGMKKFVADALAIFRPHPVQRWMQVTALGVEGNLTSIKVCPCTCHIDGYGSAGATGEKIDIVGELIAEGEV